MSDARVDRLITFYHLLTPEAVAHMGDFYARDAYFKDPFNEVNSLDDIQRIFRHMFLSLAEVKFTVLETIAQESGVVLVWDFTFRIRKYKPEIMQRIRGVSHIRFNADGKVNYHRDYWDAAEELYEKLPLVGPLMRFLKRRVG
ncbi:MAG: nuclear transport factor 2 family protein [Burkholderiales bacterium]